MGNLTNNYNRTTRLDQAKQTLNNIWSYWAMFALLSLGKPEPS